MPAERDHRSQCVAKESACEKGKNSDEQSQARPNPQNG
jgi:hypothetical protein